MQSTAIVQKTPASDWDACDPSFTKAFYLPYEKAVETAFVMLSSAKRQLMEESVQHTVHAVTFRLKSPQSIRGKLIKKGLPVSSAAACSCLQDIAGMRVVLSSIDAIYRFAGFLRASSLSECIGMDDYIASPKPSGYQSLHLIMRLPVLQGGVVMMIPVEIQLRTTGMDIWASIEHELCYKPTVHPVYAIHAHK